MNIKDLFNNNDVYFEITSYLDFENKVILSKTIKKNCLRKYNFNSKDFRYKNMEDLFTLCSVENDDEICEYMADLCSIFQSELNTYYDEYNEYDITDYMNDYYNNIKYFKHQELSELFHSSYISVYTRKVAEHIENNNLSLDYYNYDLIELDEKIDINIHDLVIDYYKYVFDFEDLDMFCRKCGLFDHYNGSKECLFYNKFNENRIIKKKVNKTMCNIIDKIVDNHKKEENRLKNEPLLCYSCKVHNKKAKCVNNYCGMCCNGCVAHKYKK